MLSQCIEPFEPEGTSFEQLYVVDGIITNEFKAHEIILAQTTSLDLDSFSPVSGAQISISVNKGFPLALTEIAPGSYITPLFEGRVGSTYSLEIITPSGEVITSPSVALKPIPEIKCLEAAFETDDPNNRGISISVTSEASSEDVLNLRWEFTETYEFRSIYPYRFDWVPGVGAVEVDVNESNVCFISQQSPSIQIFSGITQEVQQARNQEIRFIPELSEELESHYSIEVTQYALDQEGFEYWEVLQELNDNQGSTFDIQPGRVIGNLTSMSGSAVLGYFDATAVSTQRIFVRPVQFPGLQLDRTRRERCSRTRASLAPFAIAEYMEIYGDRQNIVGAITGGGFIVASKECTDCRLFGTNEKPSFWP